MLGKGAKSAKPVATLIADPIVEQAMKSLTSAINRGTAVLNGSDEDHAKRILRILRAHVHQRACREHQALGDQEWLASQDS